MKLYFINGDKRYMSARRTTIAILIILIVSFTGIIGYVLFINNKTTNIKVIQPTEKSIYLESGILKQKENWKLYQSKKYKFVISYPAYLKPLRSQTSNFFEARSSAEMLQIKILNKPLDGTEFLASDGVVGNSIFTYSVSENKWKYVGMYGGPKSLGDKSKYKVYDVRPKDGAYLRKEGYIPLKYKTKNGLSTWVGKSTNKHSTQGGDSWQIAFIESPKKQFIIEVYMKQCDGFYNSCVGDANTREKSIGDSQTIFSVINTLRVEDF